MITKFCKACSETKPITEFYTNGRYKGKQQYKPKCKRCENAVSRAKYVELIAEHFGGYRCQHCGFEGDPCQYDCHHLEPSAKSFGIAQQFRKATNSPAVFIAELDKCILLCSNCHRLEHTRQ